MNTRPFECIPHQGECRAPNGAPGYVVAVRYWSSRTGSTARAITPPMPQGLAGMLAVRMNDDMEYTANMVAALT